MQTVLKDVLGQGQKPTLKDRNNLPYIEATITEILRVAPTTPGSLPHSTIRDTEICGYKIPEGTQVHSWAFPEQLFVTPGGFIRKAKDSTGRILHGWTYMYMSLLHCSVPWFQIQAVFINVFWNPVLFPEPDVVKPERHLDTEGKLIRNEVLTPFGVGESS